MNVMILCSFRINKQDYEIFEFLQISGNYDSKIFTR